MRKSLFHSLFSTIITLIVLMPFAMQTLHALEGHEHVYCNEVNEKHFHKKEIDCQFYHLKITYNSYNFKSDFTIYEPEFNFASYKEFNQSYFHLFSSFKSSRAPPYFIV